MRPNLEAILFMVKVSKNGNKYSVTVIECGGCGKEIHRKSNYVSVNDPPLCRNCANKKKIKPPIKEEEHKECYTCGEILPIAYFFKSQVNRDYNRSCNKCNALRKYGINLADYKEILDKQEGNCAICGNPETDIRNGEVCNLAVDHNHETGEVRGLLCRSCNTALGLLKDDVTILKAAIDYLNKSTAVI